MLSIVNCVFLINDNNPTKDINTKNKHEWNLAIATIVFTSISIVGLAVLLYYNSVFEYSIQYTYGNLSGYNKIGIFFTIFMTIMSLILSLSVSSIVFDRYKTTVNKDDYVKLVISELVILSTVSYIIFNMIVMYLKPSELSEIKDLIKTDVKTKLAKPDKPDKQVESNMIETEVAT
jgi:cellulose synthase/poly-beta-1,6-N-acetylglucosamine synthase-like glycosyltransferase